MTKNNFSVLWIILGIIMIINVAARAIMLISNFDIITLFDFILNLIICILLFSKNFFGVILLTFALFIGLVNFKNGYVVIFQIILLMISFPLWIQHFSRK
jgi:hypothetical protein